MPERVAGAGGPKRTPSGKDADNPEATSPAQPPKSPKPDKPATSTPTGTAATGRTDATGKSGAPGKPRATRKPRGAGRSAATGGSGGNASAARPGGAGQATGKARKAGDGTAGGPVRARLAEPGSWAVLVVCLLAVLLFAMMLRGASQLVGAAAVPEVAAIQIATFLSSLLLAGLLLGAAGGLGVVRLLAGRDGTRLLGLPGRRALLTLLGGLVTGVAGGGTAYLLEGALRTTDGLTVGATIALAALVGGALAALRPGVMVLAGLAGTIVVIVLLSIRSLFVTPLTRLFGGGSDPHANAVAQSNLALVSFLVAGVVAGVAVHLYARRTGNRLRTAATIAAGATPGALSLIGQLLTWLGAARLVSSAGGIDLGDQYGLRVANEYQLVGSMGLLFAGALTAVLLYGRTLGPRRPRRPATPPPKPEWAVREERRAAELDRAEARRARSGEQTD